MTSFETDHDSTTGLLVKSVYQNFFLNQNIFCGYSKELTLCNVSFDYPKHMSKLMRKKIFTI